MNQNTKKSKVPVFLLILFLIALFGLGIGGYVYYLNKEMDGSLFASKESKSANKEVNNTDATGSNDDGKDLVDITDYNNDGASNEGVSDDVLLNAPEESTLIQTGLSFDSNGYFQHLSGNFDSKISSSDDVLTFLTEYSDKMGITDPKGTLKYEEESTYDKDTTYYFKQVMQDVPVYSNWIVVTTDSENKVTSVNGTYTPLEPVNTTPGKTLAEAEDIAKNYVGENARILESELNILTHTKSGSPLLIYAISAVGDSKAVELILDANTGDIIEENDSNNYAMEPLDIDTNGKTYHVELDKTLIPDEYKLQDTSRDIIICYQPFSQANAVFSNIGNPGLLVGRINERYPNGHVSLITYYDRDWGTKTGVRDLTIDDPVVLDAALIGLTTLQNAYDYYNDTFHWKSLNGHGKNLEIIVGMRDPESGDPENEEVQFAPPITSLSLSTGYSSVGHCFLFGVIDGKTPLAGIGITGHEYTHGVIDYRTKLKDTPIGKVTNEGFADVMGSIIADDWDFLLQEVPSDWEYYSYLCRSASKPHTLGYPERKGSIDPYYIELNLEDDRTDNDDPHVNATIISHAGYLMNQYGMTKEEIADLFFNAMPALAGEPEFDEVAHILIDTAKRIFDQPEKWEIVENACAETRMLDPDENLSLSAYVHCGNHPIPNATVSISGLDKITGTTDDSGNVVFKNTGRVGYVSVTVDAEGFESGYEKICVYDDIVNLDFDLAPNKDFGEVKGSDSSKKGNPSGETVTVTFMGMNFTNSSNQPKESAQEYSVRKGSKIDLKKLVDQLHIPYLTTDGTTLYFETGEFPLELSYYIYGTDEVFDFSKPINEDVIIEPKIGIEGLNLGSQDISDLLKELDKDYNGNDLNDVANELDRIFNGDGLKDFADDFYEFWED